MNICIVSSDLLGFINNGGVGTANYHLAKYLTSEHKVDILFVTYPNKIYELEYKIWKNEYKKMGINVKSLTYPLYHVETPYLYLIRSYLVFLNLKNSKYDLIIFPEMHGLGYYCMQAKSIQTHFQETKLITMYHGPSEWHHRFNNGLPSTWSELAKFHLEKQSCILADHIYFATNHARTIAYDLGYFRERETQTNEVLLYPFDQPNISNFKKQSNQNHNEVCFIGRCETRKGLGTFLNSVKILKANNNFKNITFTIIGKIGVIDSISSNDYIYHWMKENSIRLKIINDFGTAELYNYLNQSKALAIMASQEETMGYTLIECLVNDVPFICSDIPPFEEILTIFKPKNSYTFKSGNHTDLAEKIKKCLLKPIAYPKSNISNTKNIKLWQNSIRKFEKTNAKIWPIKIGKISICIIFFDRPDFLKQLIATIAPIDDYVNEILIYINKATLIESKKYIKELNKIPKVVLFYDKFNVSPGCARNFLGFKASSETILFVDDDNLLDYKAIIQILEANFKDWDIICSSIKKFNNKSFTSYSDSLSPQKLHKIITNCVQSHWVPLGNDITLSTIENKIGDCNFLVKREHLLQLGGFDESLFYGEDQEFLVRSILNKGRYFISPEGFIFYRYHGSNLSRKVEHTAESLNLMEIILNKIGQNHNVPFFQMVKAWDFEKDRNWDWADIGMIQDFINYQIYQNYLKKSNKQKLNKIIRNNLSFDTKISIYECPLIMAGQKQTKAHLVEDQEIDITFYMLKSLKFKINKQLVSLNPGYTKMSIKYNIKSGITFYGEASESIYIAR